jgi:hypothetical protein
MIQCISWNIYSTGQNISYYYETKRSTTFLKNPIIESYPGQAEHAPPFNNLLL